MPRAIHLLPARQALFCPAQDRHGKAGYSRAFLALPELCREYGDRGALRRQSVVSLTPALRKHVAACVRALNTSSGQDRVVCSAAKIQQVVCRKLFLYAERSIFSLMHPIAHGEACGI